MTRLSALFTIYVLAAACGYAENAIPSILVTAAESTFGDLTRAERLMFKESENGGWINCVFLDDDNRNPAEADTWSDERVIRADRFQWLCLNSTARKFVSDKGIQIQAARIEGELNLDSARIPFAISFAGCSFKGNISLRRATLGGLYISKSYIRSIYASDFRTDGSLVLSDGCSITGEVKLLGAFIGGDLAFPSATFRTTGSPCLIADGMKLGGSMILSDGFTAAGEVGMKGASIGGDLDCSSSSFANTDNNCITADGMKVQGSVCLREGFSSTGLISLSGVSIAGDLDCTGASLSNPGKVCVIAENAMIEKNLFLRNGFSSTGLIVLVYASIGGVLDCSRGAFSNPGNICFNADGIKASHDVVFCEGFSAKGEVRLSGASIGGALDCRSGLFDNPKERCIRADGIKVASGVLFREGFRARGQVCLTSAFIGGSLNCVDARFENPENVCLDAGGIKIEGGAFFRGFSATGEVLLGAACIGGILGCEESTFDNPKGMCLEASGIKVEQSVFFRKNAAKGAVVFTEAEIGHQFQWFGIQSPDAVVLVLNNAEIGGLWDEEASWPKAGHLLLQGLTYDNIDYRAPVDAQSRIEWIRRQATDCYSPQPYAQCAAVLRRQGHEQEAIRVLIASKEDPAYLRGLSWFWRSWNFVYGKTTGFGHAPGRAFWSIILFLFMGYVLFGKGHRSGLITPSEARVIAGPKGALSENTPDYPTFIALFYSLDCFFPFVNFHQQNYWLPNANKGKAVLFGRFTWGGLLRLYLMIHIAMGWLLSTLFVLGVTGLVRG